MDERYPAGRFDWSNPPGPIAVQKAVDAIRAFPAELRGVVSGLNEGQLERRYRDGGWTIRQVVHHLADSHMNSYIRFRLALTEDLPAIKPYDEAAWAELTDARHAPLELSLGLIGSLHARWVLLLESLSPEDWNKKFRHPERGEISLRENAALYAWHGEHHLAHIRNALARTA